MKTRNIRLLLKSLGSTHLLHTLHNPFLRSYPRLCTEVKQSESKMAFYKKLVNPRSECYAASDRDYKRIEMEYKNNLDALHKTQKENTIHFKNTLYKNKSEAQETELLSQILTLQNKIDDFNPTCSTHPSLLSELESKINAAREVLNPKFQRMIIGNRGWSADRIRKVGQELGLDIYIMYMKIDEKTPAVQSLPPEKRILVSHYGNIDEIKKVLLHLKEGTGFHPGVGGFLSENAEFAKWCEDNGIVFIGPSSQSMFIFSDKGLAKITAETAGIPIPKSYSGENQDPEFLVQQAREITYPVMVKLRRGGGGGKGNREVFNDYSLRNALKELKGDVTIEKYIEDARHIEFQILGCSLGVWVIDVRDCSMQQKNQKGLEKRALDIDISKPKAFMPKLCAKLASLGYIGAGTIEFLLDKQGEWYFMEKNTRLQVEHPISNRVTGLDILEWSLRICAGRTTQHYLDKMWGHDLLHSNHPQKRIDNRFQKQYIRQIRILAVDVLPNVPKIGDVFYSGIKGTVTKVIIPESSKWGCVTLGVSVGTELDYLNNPLDPQIGWVQAVGNTQQEADERVMELASRIKIEVNDENKPLNIPHACYTLNHIAKTGIELIKTWPEINKLFVTSQKESKEVALGAKQNKPSPR